MTIQEYFLLYTVSSICVIGYSQAHVKGRNPNASLYINKIMFAKGRKSLANRLETSREDPIHGEPELFRGSGHEDAQDLPQMLKSHQDCA